VIPFAFGFYYLLRRVYIDYAPAPQSSTHVIANSGRHITVSVGTIYIVLHLFAVPMLSRNPAKLGPVWLYFLVASAT